MYHYTEKNILESLAKLGINSGDDIFIHSNLGFFGILEGCKSSEELSETFQKAILKLIGAEGTLVLPTFSYSFCHNEIYNPVLTKSTCGIFPEYLRKSANSRRSLDPNFSITAVGKKMDFYTENPTHESFGKGSFWERFMNNNGKILCMNFDSGSTFVHYVEQINKVPYRYNKAFNGIIENGSETIRDYFVHYVYDLDKPEDAPDFTELDKLCKQNGISHTVPLGKGSMLIFSTKEYFDFISQTLKTRPRFLTARE